MKYEERQLMEKAEARERRKKPYASPRLTNHGDVREITQALDIGGSDGQGGSRLADGVG